MAGADQNSYIFQRDYRAPARLDLQHYHWQDTLGYLVHPKINLRGKAVKVLDVGCGSGIWLNHVARSLPSSASLVGTDIDISQCPPTLWLSPNVTFRTWNIFEEPPDDLGSFDMIHVQLLIYVIKDNDALNTVLSRVNRLLKPGGWIQWGKYDHLNNIIVKTSPDISSEKFEGVIDQIGALAGTPPQWVQNLEKSFISQGLLEVEKHTYWPENYQLPGIMDTIFKGIDEMIETIANPQQVTHLRSLFDGAVRESGQGISWTGSRVVVIGRKAKITPA